MAPTILTAPLHRSAWQFEWPVPRRLKLRRPLTVEGNAMQISPRVPGRFLAIAGLASILTLTACTQEQQNKFGRGVQNWTGTDGVLDVYAGEKLAMRFIQIDKMSTGIGTSDSEPRSFRYGYGVVDENFNWLADPGEKKVYFEVSDYSTSYVFYENYKN